jgi:hypothetical protein
LLLVSHTFVTRAGALLEIAPGRRGKSQLMLAAAMRRTRFFFVTE